MQDIIIFYSNSPKAHALALGVKENLESNFNVELWKEGFFSKNSSVPLQQFLKNLLCYDFAIIILTEDDTRKKNGDEDAETELVPRDNVIFELGACSARLGPHRTFTLVPNLINSKISLPSYFKGISLLDYKDSDNKVAATGTACSRIIQEVNNLDQNAFHSDLPSQGLAFGYFGNFILPIYNNTREEQEVSFYNSSPKWHPNNGLTITIVIPDKVMNRQGADSYFLNELSYENTKIKLDRNRDMSVYVQCFNTGQPMHIFDIPTTLLTTEKVLEKVDSFWGKFGGSKFKSDLLKREMKTFKRTMETLIPENKIEDGIVFIKHQSEVPAHLEFLKKHSPPKLGW